MKYRQLGRTGLLVSRMSLGTNTFGGAESERWAKLGGLDRKSATAIVAACVEAGVNLIDTADVYGFGESETRVGEALRDLKLKRSEVVIVTKVGLRMGPKPNEVGLSRAHITASLEASLKRLGTDHVDIYMMHRFDPLTPLEESLRAIDDLVRAGKVRYVGCSNFSAWHVMKGLGISAREALARFEVLESHYSLATRDLEREVVPMLESEQVGLMVWGPLLGGFLTGKYRRDGTGPDGTRLAGKPNAPVDVERVHDIIDVARKVAAGKGVPVGHVALAWLLHRPAVTSVVVGARTAAQIQENLGALEVALAPEDLALLDKASALTPEYPGWMHARFAPDRPMPD
jgi:aryl-alcohol dehydrogenase-like predicted oxidoreductase